jgi:uncharacterized alpha-E superfamily protein
MLSRTAANLYWLARYMERAENFARMLDVVERTSLMPNNFGSDLGDSEYNEWWLNISVSSCCRLRAYEAAQALVNDEDSEDNRCQSDGALQAAISPGQGPSRPSQRHGNDG